MVQFDLPLDELRSYRPDRDEPSDFEDFWARTLTESAQLPVTTTLVGHESGLSEFQVYDVRFTGYGGHSVAGWLIAPNRGDLGCVVHYIGYGGGRIYPHDWLLWPAAGYAVLVMDTRSQGGGATADPAPGTGPESAGVLTRGITSPEDYYYRRVFVDAVRAVDAAAGLPMVDPTRIMVTGRSQGGALAQVVAGLRTDLRGAMVDVPFLTHFRRAVRITDATPYAEIVTYCAKNRVEADQVFRTLSYFDGMHFAARAQCPALYSVGLMDKTCPPSTVFAAYNHYLGGADIDVWEFNGHEGGGSEQQLRQVRWANALLQSGDALQLG